jgi:hypothetical protein
MNIEQLRNQYRKEKWQIKLRKKYQGYSPEVKKYLIHKKMRDLPFLFECLIDYCMNPGDDGEEREFADSTDYLYKKFHTFIKAVKFLQKDNEEIRRFLFKALNMFEDVDGKTYYPGKDICLTRLTELNDLVGDYEQNLYEALLIEPDGSSIQDKTTSENIKAILEEVLLKKGTDKTRGQNRRIEKERRKKECYRLYDEQEKNESKDPEPLRKAKIAKKIGVSTKSVTRYLQERE